METKRRRGQIAMALLAALVSVTIAPLMMLSWRLIRVNQEELAIAHQGAQYLVARSLARAIDLQVDGLQNELLHLAQTLSIAVSGQHGLTQREVDRVLDEVTGVLDGVTDERVPALRFSYFNNQSVDSASAGTMPRELEPHFEQILARAIEVHAERRGESWSLLSGTLALADGTSVVLIAAPVVAHGAFRGVLWGLVDLERVWIDAQGGRSAGYVAFAVDEEGALFASSHPERVAAVDAASSPLVGRFLASGGRATGTLEFDLADGDGERPYVGAFEVTGQGWGIFVQAPRSEVFAAISRMRWQTLKWSCVALGVAALVAMIMARTLSDPIQQLAIASRQFARGDFSTRVRISSRNEVGELAETFNQMAGEIERYISRIKKGLEEKNELFLGTIRSLAQAIDAKDPYTRGHSDRVTRYAVILARELGLPAREVRDIHVSAQLHDVGKIGINDAILQKPGALTDDEFAVMKTHTVKGAEIMSQIPQMERIIPGLRWHHERADGRGYPDGLTNEQIPMMARIIAVADTFDAITTSRPYQQPMTFERAKARIDELRGVALDKDVVDAFRRACAKGTIHLEETPAPEAVGT